MHCEKDDFVFEDELAIPTMAISMGENISRPIKPMKASFFGVIAFSDLVASPSFLGFAPQKMAKRRVSIDLGFAVVALQ